MLNQGPNNHHQLIASYKKLRKLDSTLPAIFPRTDTLREYINAINQVKEAQLSELHRLREKHDEVVTRYVSLIHSVRYATEVDNLIAIDQAIDAINNEIICTRIDLNNTTLDLSDSGITRVPSSLFKMIGFLPFFSTLEEINCSKNHLKTLSLRNLPSLQIIDCNDTTLEHLNLQNLPELADISILNSNLKGSLDFRAFPKLYAICLHNNNIEAIDVRGLQALEQLDCSSNNLIELDVDSPVIRDLNCSWNHIVRLNITHVNKLKLPKKIEALESVESEEEEIGDFLLGLPVMKESESTEESSEESNSEIGGLHLYVNALNEIPQNLVQKFGEEWAAEELGEQLNLGIPQHLLRDKPQMPAPVAQPIPAAAEVLPQFQLQTRIRTRSQAAKEEEEAKAIKKPRKK